jgi:glycosyltransferase involved in cell wall biosynthesis
VRVLIVDHTAGIAPFRRKFAALASRSGIDLTVLAPARWVENYREVRAVPSEENGFRLLTGRVIWPGYENRGFFVSGLGPALRAARPELIHLWEEPFSFIALQAQAQAALRSSRAPILFSTSDDLSRGFRYPYRPSSLYARIERLTLSRAAGATYMNRRVHDLLREKGFGKPLEQITHGLDLADYPCSLAERAAVSEAQPLTIGYIGRLTWQKGVDILLRALARCGPGRTMTLDVVGDGPERERLRSLASELGLGDRVRFRPPVPHADVPRVLRGFDVLVLPSRTIPTSQEHFGRVLIEGMAAGCVVIGTDSGAIPEVIDEAGIVVPEENPGALSEALERLRSRATLAGELRERGRERVKALYTWSAITVRLAAFYERILTTPRGSNA